MSVCCRNVQKCDLSHISAVDMRSVVTRHQKTELFFIFDVTRLSKLQTLFVGDI